jgi:hypothetical protein
MTQEDWSDKDRVKSLEESIQQLDFPCLVVNNYRFYNNNFLLPKSAILGVSGISSPSMMLYQSMMRSYPCTAVRDMVGKYFFSMQKARGIDFGDKSDNSKFQAFDSLVLGRTNSGKKRSMKRLALLNIQDAIKMELNTKSVSEKTFLDNHPGLWKKDQQEEIEEDQKQEQNENDEDREDFMELVDEYPASEEKYWDCYQLF